MKKDLLALSICTIALFSGCIDREFDLAETSGEMTIGGEELVVPLGEISPIYLNDLLKENETIKPNENGVYQIAFSSFGDDPTKVESITIDGIKIGEIACELPQLEPIKFSAMGSLPRSFQMSGFSQKMSVNIPTIGNVVNIDPIKSNIELGLGSNLPISGKGVLSETHLALLQNQNIPTTLSTSISNELTFEAEINILKELKQVDWVEFGCEEHPYGTPFKLNVDITGIRDINGGGVMRLRVEFPDGYHLHKADDVETDAHNIFEEDIHIAPKQSEVEVLFYLYKIDCENKVFSEGKAYLNEKIKYSCDFEIDLCAGSYNLDAPQQLSIEAEPKYKDVEIIINEFDVPGDKDKISVDVNYTFNGLPNGIEVSKVAFSEAQMRLTLSGLEWLVVQCRDTDTTFSPPIEITLPECMHFKRDGRSSINGNILIATAEELSRGITLDIDYIDCTADGISQEDGKLVIDTQLSAMIHLEGLSNHTILVSDLTPPASFNGNIGISVSDTELVIDAAKSEIISVNEQSFPLDLGNNMPSLNYDIDIPEMISKINRIDICNAANTDEPVKMSFTIKKANAFPVEELDINLMVNLGKMLKPTDEMLAENGGPIRKESNGDYILDIKEPWRPTESDLHKELKFEALENIPAIVNGKLSVNQSFPVTGSVTIKSGENLDLSSDAEVNIDIALDNIKVKTFKGNVDMSVKPENDIVVELGDMSDIGIEINSLNLNPVLNLKLNNPTGIAFNADLSVKTYDADNNPMATITVPTIPIDGSGESHIVISTPRNENQYKDEEDVYFVPIEGLAKLLSKGIPAKIAVDMEVASNKNEEITIDLLTAERGYTFEYQYEVVIPLEFDGNIDLSCETVVTGLNDTFVELADQTNGLKVGDVGLVAEFGSTIPFDIVLSAELINRDGNTNGIEARLDIKDCLIEGYNKDTDSEKRISKVDLNFDLGESGSLAGLRNADGVRLKFTIYNSGNDAASLINTQHLEGKLKLRVREGLTVDIFELLNGKEE